MKVSVFGLGYVGTVSAACLAQGGHEVIGIDPVASKVDLISAGKAPIIEADIQEIIASAVKTNRLRAIQDPIRAMEETDLFFLCVGTPSQINGNLDLRYIRRVCEEVGLALRNKTPHHTIVIRSRLYPGTMRRAAIRIL